MHKDFCNLVENVHADLAQRDKGLDSRIQTLDLKIDKIHTELMKEIKEVKEILFAHDKRIATSERI